MALRVSGDEFEEKVLRANRPVLVDFYSETCIPCKKMSVLLGELEEEYGDRICFYRVNVNYEEKLAEQYRVLAAPTLLLFADGAEQKRLSGTVDREDIAALFLDI